MIVTEALLDAERRRSPSRRFLMCVPEYFSVDYEINPWMDATRAVDRHRAVAQWEELVAVMGAVGHEVQLIEPVAGLPDMVFAANAGLVISSVALVSHFRHPQRRREADLYHSWLIDHGFTVVQRARTCNEGEGDLLVAGGRILAGHGFRTDLAAHREVEQLFGLPVVSLRLIDPRFYHLDTALAVLGDDQIAWYPPAFDPLSQQRLAKMFPDAVVAGEADATAFGLNAISDGHHVIVAAEAEGMVASLSAAGFEVFPVEMSELRRAGGAAKCCALELYP